MPTVDQIVREADERLNLFYSYYGDWDGCKKVKKGERRKCQVSYCKKSVPTGSSSKVCLFHQKKKAGILDKPKGTNKTVRMADAFNNVPQKIITKEVDLRGLKAKEIISKVFGLIGKNITISEKSKSRIIKSAQELFIKEGYKVLCDEIKVSRPKPKVLKWITT